ncbi:MAG: oxidoreductase [Candidatus Latescibacteria bacterium 4484_107]|nr:MAG: oxidoreductase [Candidatus Latescibacteria bacterium 4484_107]
METKVKVGVIGCGNISGAYFRGCKAYELLDVVACADLLMERAEAKAEEFGIEKACSVEELLGDPEIQIVVNLTVPKVHAEVNLRAIEAGKHVHCEKPFAIERAEGRKVLEAAREKGVLVGGAPDTFLGGGIQTCRKLLDDGWIGEPIAAVAFMAGHGPESWHPAPDFFYQKGGGPMFDMGPYYLTALINLLGPVKRVTGSTRISFPERVITNEARYGERIPVEIPTHISGVVDFDGGPVATLMMSFDVWSHSLPRIEVYGSEGSLSVPDPNCFDGPVRVRRAGDDSWSEVPLTHSPEVSRGIGVADMAYALIYGRPHRASGALAYHVLDVMQSFEEASTTGRHLEIRSGCSRPAPLPMGLLPGTLDTA